MVTLAVLFLIAFLVYMCAFINIIFLSCLFILPNTYYYSWLETSVFKFYFWEGKLYISIHVWRRNITVMILFSISVHVFVLFLNILASLAYLIVDTNNGGTVFGLSILWFILFTPCSFLCWYRPVYKAFRWVWNLFHWRCRQAGVSVASANKPSSWDIRF